MFYFLKNSSILLCQQPKRRGESRVPLSKAQSSFLRNDIVLAIIEFYFALISSASPLVHFFSFLLSEFGYNNIFLVLSSINSYSWLIFSFFSFIFTIVTRSGQSDIRSRKARHKSFRTFLVEKFGLLTFRINCIIFTTLENTFLATSAAFKNNN